MSRGNSWDSSTNVADRIAWCAAGAARAPRDHLPRAHRKDTPDPPGAEIQRDRQGNPTGVLIAKPNTMILYQTLAKGPKLPPDEQANSTRHFMREMNRLGLTSVIDAAGGCQNQPDDYEVIEKSTSGAR